MIPFFFYLIQDKTISSQKVPHRNHSPINRSNIMNFNSQRSIRQFYRRIRRYLWFFMAVFAANAMLSLFLFIWIVNTGLNEKAESWSTYFEDRISFLENTMISGSALDFGISSVMRVSTEGRIESSRPAQTSISDISRSPLFDKIKTMTADETRIVQFRNLQDPALNALYLVRRHKDHYLVGLLNSKGLLPMTPRSLQMLIYNKAGKLQFSTVIDPAFSKIKFNQGLIFRSGKAYAVEHSKIESPGGLKIAVVKDVSKEFYGFTFLMLFTTLALLAVLMRSNRISGDLQMVESEFRKINGLLSGITPAKSTGSVPVVMQDVADDLRRIDWDEIAESTVFQENRMYLHSTAFFARNMVHLLDAVSAHSKALSVSEEKYRELVNRAHSIILRLDVNGNITFFNEFAQKFFGYSEEELLGKNVIGTIVPEKDSAGRNLKIALRAITSSPESMPVSNNENMCKDGTLVWVHWTNRPVYDSSGQISEILCVGMDITDRKKAEHELRKARNYIKDIIDSMPSVVIGVDHEHNVTHYNLAAGQKAAVPEKEIQDTRLEKAFPQLGRISDKIDTAIRTGHPDVKNRAMNASNGNLHYEDIMIFPLTGSGEHGAVIRIDDVTERVRIEEIMIQTEKMMSVGGLAAGMAHEINNPLGGILQGIQNIIRRLSPDIKANKAAAERAGCDLDSVLQYMEDRKIISMLDGITESGVRAADIVSGMLEFSRRSDSRKAPGRLEALLDNTINLAAKDYDLKKRYDFKQIEIVRNYEPDIPAVLCSNTEIEQVFLNLLRNSAQAMSAWDEMKETPRIEVSISSAGEMVRCQVKDNGPGMDAETRKRVFEPFFTTKDPGVGTGLGLSVSYFIITKNHNGIFEVNSKPGEGTTFTIMLPAAS